MSEFVCERTVSGKMTEMASVVRVIASCAVVCGLAWWLGVLLKRLQPFQTNGDRKLRLIELLPLGGGKSIALVSCYDRKFLIALTQQSIQLLAELSSNELSSEQANGLEQKLADKRQDGDGTSVGGRNKLTNSLRRFFPTLPLLALLLVAVSVASPQSQASSPQQQLSLMRESIQILAVLTLIALAPFLLAVMTCFTRIVIVLSLLRVAMGTPQTPPNPVVIGMALFLTMFVMAPTLQEANEKGLQPFLRNEVSLEQAIAEGYKPFHKFMLRQVREKDIALFLRIAKLPNPRTPDDLPAYILIPAFILSEVRTGFEIGFLLSVPFLVVDLVIASVLMGMGMLMVPPMLISLPLKLLLFVLADGWHLLMRGLALSVR